MKKFLSSKKVAGILLAVTIISLSLYTYVITSPISYGMGYHVKTESMGMPFEGTMTFKKDGTVINRNTNFIDERTSRYYYRDGYIFFTLATDDEGYEKEVAEINADFEKAVNTPFYACETNAFKLYFAGEDDYSMVYTCTATVIYTWTFGVIELALTVFTCMAFILSKKNSKNEQI